MSVLSQVSERSEYEARRAINGRAPLHYVFGGRSPPKCVACLIKHAGGCGASLPKRVRRFGGREKQGRGTARRSQHAGGGTK